MTTLQNALFGRLTFDGDGVADTTLPMGDREIDLDVWFDEHPDGDLLDQAAALLSDVDSLDAVCRAAIAEDRTSFELYAKHHVEELPEAELLRLCGVASKDEVDGEVFMAALKLVKLDLYPDAEEDLLNCDYSIAEELTDYVLSVAIDRDGEVAEVAMES